MSNDSALAQYTNGSRQIAEGAMLVPAMITRGAEAHLVAWSRTQALKAGHEAGHTVVAALLMPEDGGPIATYEVSIKGAWSGETRLAEGDDNQVLYATASRKRALMIVCFAGLEAERALFSEATDGSVEDIDRAADLAASIITAGLHPEASLTTFAPFGYSITPPRWLVDERYRLVEKEMQRARERARELVAENKDRILAFARILFESRRMESAAIDAALTSVGVTPVERLP